MTLLNLKPKTHKSSFCGSEHGKSSIPLSRTRKWMFESVLGSGIERTLDYDEDVEAICCEMARITHLPTKCYPVLIETSSGRKRGVIIL